MTKATNIEWQPFRGNPHQESDQYHAQQAWQIATAWFSDFGTILVDDPDAFAKESPDVFRFRIDSAGKSMLARVEVSWRDAEDSRDYCVRVDVTSG